MPTALSDRANELPPLSEASGFHVHMTKPMALVSEVDQQAVDAESLTLSEQPISSIEAALRRRRRAAIAPNPFYGKHRVSVGLDVLRYLGYFAPSGVGGSGPRFCLITTQGSQPARDCAASEAREERSADQKRPLRKCGRNPASRNRLRPRIDAGSPTLRKPVARAPLRGRSFSSQRTTLAR